MKIILKGNCVHQAFSQTIVHSIHRSCRFLYCSCHQSLVAVLSSEWATSSSLLNSPDNQMTFIQHIYTGHLAPSQPLIYMNLTFFSLWVCLIVSGLINRQLTGQHNDVTAIHPPNGDGWSALSTRWCKMKQAWPSAVLACMDSLRCQHFKKYKMPQ